MERAHPSHEIVHFRKPISQVRVLLGMVDECIDSVDDGFEALSVGESFKESTQLGKNVIEPTFLQVKKTVSASRKFSQKSKPQQRR
jgi:hypothetical protein